MALLGLRCLLRELSRQQTSSSSSGQLLQAVCCCCHLPAAGAPVPHAHEQQQQQQVRWLSAAAAPAASPSSSSSSNEEGGSRQHHQQQQPAVAAGRAGPSGQQQQQHLQQQDHQQQQQQQQQELPGGSAALQALAASYQRSRLQQYYAHHLARDLLLKLNVGTVEALPLVRGVDLSIPARDLLGRRYAEKWEMLLPALALEYIAGRPATYVTSKLKYYRARNVVTAVKVAVRGGEAFEVLQKLCLLVLPSQDGFSGISSRSFDAAGNLHFRVPRMVNFPDFEEQFEVFENLRGLHVSINLGNVAKHRARAKLLLTGLQLPILTKGGGAGVGAAAASEGVAAGATGQDGGGAAVVDSDGSGSSSEEDD